MGPGSSLCSTLCQGHIHPCCGILALHLLHLPPPATFPVLTLPGCSTSVLSKIYIPSPCLPQTHSHPLLLFMGRGKTSRTESSCPRALRLLLSSRESPALRLHPWKCLTGDFQLGDDVNQMWPLQRATQGGTHHGGGLGDSPVPLEGWAGFSPGLPFPKALLALAASLGEKQNSQNSSGSQQLFALLPKSAESH